MPIIPVTLSYRFQTAKVEAYVDSGASYSIFGAEVAEGMDLSLSHGKRRVFVVGDGNRIVTWVLKLSVGIGMQSFAADVAFSEGLKVGFNLLGRRGIFDHFEEVVFQEKRRKIIFKV